MKKYCEAIAEKVWSDLSRSNLVTGEKLGRVPQIRFTALGEKFLGMAYGDHIELNEIYLQTEDKEKLKMTLLHELAHVAEFRSTGIMGHGPLWHAFVCISAAMVIQEVICPKRKTRKQMISFSDLQRSLLLPEHCFLPCIVPLTFWGSPIKSSAERAASAALFYPLCCGRFAAKLLNRSRQQLSFRLFYPSFLQ